MQLVYHFTNELLYFKEKIFLPDAMVFRRTILHEYHNTPTSGHSSLKPTISCISSTFLWPGLYKDVKKFVQECLTCQQNKYLPTKKQGLLQPLEIHAQVWEDLLMDFITNLPKSFGHIVIRVFYKFMHLLPYLLILQLRIWPCVFWWRFVDCVVYLNPSFQTGIQSF